MPQTSQSDGLPVPQRYGAILAIALGITVAVLDGAIANVALPTIARELHASPAESIWIVNAYQLAIIISLLSLSFLGIFSAIAASIRLDWSSLPVPRCCAPSRPRWKC